MVPVAERLGPSQARKRTIFEGEADPMSMPSWTRGDESDEEFEQGSKLRRRLSHSSRQDRKMEKAGAVKRRNVESTTAQDSGRLSRRDSSGSEDERSSTRVITRTRAESEPTSVPALPAVPPPAPTSTVLPPPPPPPPPPPSSAVEPTSTELPPPPPPQSTSLELPPPPPPPPPSSTEPSTSEPEPTTLFQPLPGPPASSTSTETETETTSPSASTESGAPLTTVTVGNPETTESSSSSSTTTSPTITTPVVALPILPSEIRKGVDRPTDTDDATSTPSQPTESVPADRSERDRDDDGPSVHHIQPTHAAMHALGSIGGVLVIAAFLGFIWWYFKKYRHKKRLERGIPPPPPRKPGRFWKLFSLGKVSKKSSQDREWTVESAPSSAPSFDEKQMQLESTQEDTFQRQRRSVGSQYFAPAQLAVAIPPAHIDPNGNEFWTTWTEEDARPGHNPNQLSVSSTSGQFGNTLRVAPPYYKRTSEVSSLSSGFGDGDMIMPPSTANNTLDAAALTQLRPPPPTSNPRRFSARTVSTNRDTWYTEASEDQPARFRTINSWVRQQTGRVKREKQRNDDSDVPPVPALPDEEEYRMMMPDGEEPRRVNMSEASASAYSGMR
ncbi:hypothetical protein HJFPF1_06939 [Paramyrothecium foliicola]|nr:hypothetical protein HJFPF1_06939 [Paramyrothecium foliicola]